MPSSDTVIAQQDQPLVEGYATLLHRLKERIRTARVQVVLAVNRELIMLYWQIGHDILQEQARRGWGQKIAEQIAQDLRVEFPDMTGLSRRNMTYMRTFAAAYPERDLVTTIFGAIPWGHNVVLLDKLVTLDERVWYAQHAAMHGWSRARLITHIGTALHQRQGAAPSNFHRTLPGPLATLAQQVTRDPLVFELAGWTPEASERTLEQALVDRVQDLLRSLGMRIAFVGNQYHIACDGKDYYLDVLLYDLALHLYLVVELKQGEFRPEYLGQLNFYLELVDTLVRDPSADGPSIGLLICQTKRTTTVEIALRTTTKPVAISTYTVHLKQAIEDRLQTSADRKN